MLKDQIYLYINESIDETFNHIGKLNNMLDTILDNLIKNIIKIVKKDELQLFNTIIKNIILYCRYYGINDINDAKRINIKQWIDIMIICDIVLVINLIYLNMISDKLCFKFITNISLDGNNCLFMFKIMVILAERSRKLLFDYCLAYNLSSKLDSNLIKALSSNLDKFIVGINYEDNIKRAIRIYICNQIDILKQYNDYITTTTIKILDSSSSIPNSGLKEEILKNNSILADELKNKFH